MSVFTEEGLGKKNSTVRGTFVIHLLQIDMVIFENYDLF